MLQTLKNAWRTKDIRNKILFTMLIILLYRIGTVIPVPYVDAHDFAGSFSGTILDYLNLLSGGSLGQATLFALGVSPYINASIIIQLLAVVFPKLGEISKNDKKKMGYINRVTTVILAVITALGYYFLLAGSALTAEATKGVGDFYWFYGIVIVTCYVAGASLVMWLADRINEHGIGNGVSMILFANIVTALPQQAINMFYLIKDTFPYEHNKALYIILSILFALLLILCEFNLSILHSLCKLVAGKNTLFSEVVRILRSSYYEPFLVFLFINSYRIAAECSLFLNLILHSVASNYTFNPSVNRFAT